jgi:phosphatidylglycerol:prolipoprotein diacylglycerol transferase
VQSAAWQECTRIMPELAKSEKLSELAAAVRHNPEVAKTIGNFLEPRHPSQIYEALLEGGLLFSILWFVRVRFPNAPHGLLTGLFFGLYALFRILGEQFREPDASMVGPLTKGQFFSLFMFIFAAAFLFHAWRGWKRAAAAQ